MPSLSSRWRVRLGAVVLAASLIAVAACAPSRSIGAGDVSSAPAQAAVLHLTNDDYVCGALGRSAEPGRVRWQSPYFGAPFEFPLHLINAVHFALPGELPRPVGEYCFELAGGDVLFGGLAALDENVVEIDAPRFGRLHVARATIRRFYRWRDSSDLIYLGPNGLSGWQSSSTAAGPAWREESGHLLTDQFESVLRGEPGIPAQAAIEFELSWKNKPDFLFALGVRNDDDKSVEQAFRFEVWQNDIVIERENEQEVDLASVQTFSPGAGRVHLQVYLDQERGRCLVFLPTGERVADLQIGSSRPRAMPGVRLLNKHGDLRLERLRISRWNGEPPREVEAKRSRLHSADGSILYGNVSGYDAATKRFTVAGHQGRTEVPADQIASVVLPPPIEDKPRGVRAVYQDGTQLSGELLAIGTEALSLRSPGISEPLDLPTAGLRSFVVLRHDGESPAAPAGKRAGVLELDRVRLRGHLEDGRGDETASCLVWRPLGSSLGSALRPDVAGRVVYRETPPPAPVKPAPRQQAQPAQRGFLQGMVQALAGDANPRAPVTTARKALHLRTGDTIPCDVTRIDEEGVTFTTSISDATFVANDKVKALELAQPAANAIALKKPKRERLLTLPRMQRGSPPTHLIRSTNGDYLRGRLVELDEKVARVEIHLESKEVPRDRISRIIWLHPDELEGTIVPAEPSPDFAPAIRVQAVRSDGIRLTFYASELASGTLLGKGEVLGSCKVDLGEIDQLLFGQVIEVAASQLAYHQFKLHNAIDPKAFQSDGDSDEGGSSGVDSPLVGKPAPDFELDLLGGKRFRLTSAKGKVVVLDFWATWCGPCLKSMPQIAQVARDFADRNVQVVAVNLEEAPKVVASMLERHKLEELTVALDVDGAVAGKYGVTTIPQTLVIDAEGKVVRHFMGGDAHLGESLSAVLGELLGKPAAEGSK